MANGPLIIRGLATISSLGASPEEVAASLRQSRPKVSSLSGLPVFRLTKEGEAAVSYCAEDRRFASLDRTTLLALASASQTRKALARSSTAVHCVSIGSARGATTSLESSILQHAEGTSPIAVETSPITTAGNISSWVAQDFAGVAKQRRPIASIGTSMTCTSAFHSLLIAKAFLDSGMADTAIFGGAESCLTPYTLAQLSALRIYAQEARDFPCRPCFDSARRINTVTLGEGAGTALLRHDDGSRRTGDLALLGVGWSLETTPSATGVSEDGNGFEEAITRAMASLPAHRSVDAVVLHAPGSAKGDAAELSAVRRLLGDVPMCTTKHLTGHTYGASGMVSLAMAQWLVVGGMWEGVPYPSRVFSRKFEAPRTVLINTAGFGGNSISIIVGQP